MLDTTAINMPLLLVTDDRSLACLVRLECRELALPLEVAATLPQSATQRTLLIDLDSVNMTEPFAIGEGQMVAGICRDISQLPTEWQTRFSRLLQRPCPTAQLRALLGHLCGRGEMTSVAPREGRAHTALSASELKMVMAEDNQLLCGEEILSLSPTEAALMRTLIAHRGEIVSRTMLEACLPGEGEAHSNKIEVYLCFLRRKIERPLGLRLITTVRGKGYRLE